MLGSVSEDDALPRPRQDAAGLLASEPLDRYSQDELLARIARLEAEIARVRSRFEKAAADRVLAEQVFRPGGRA